MDKVVIIKDITIWQQQMQIGWNDTSIVKFVF